VRAGGRRRRGVRRTTAAADAEASSVDERVGRAAGRGQVTLLAKLTKAYRAAADPEAAAPMRAYMRDQFPFLGITRKQRDELDRLVLPELKRPTEDELRELARACWKKPEREYQYFAQKILRKHVKALTHLDLLEELITEKSWWDTVDELAQNVVGPMVLHDPKLVRSMDAWSKSDNLWLARTAILHQNKYKDRTDEKRLFQYCRARSHEKDFFVRKAIGWALRNYAATNPDAVAKFVRDNDERLSVLSKKEALRGVERAR
jgi:3-methyladenine DNA glycosylase AlkD